MKKFLLGSILAVFTAVLNPATAQSPDSVAPPKSNTADARKSAKAGKSVKKGAKKGQKKVTRQAKKSTGGKKQIHAPRGPETRHADAISVSTAPITARYLP